MPNNDFSENKKSHPGGIDETEDDIPLSGPGGTPMHEVGIATSILRAGHAEVERRPGAKLISVGVRVGVLSGVDVSSLRFAFECIVAGTEDEHVIFVTEQCPRTNQCEECGLEFVSPGTSPFLDAPCPRCHSRQTRFISGDQLDLAFVEVEEQ